MTQCITPLKEIANYHSALIRYERQHLRRGEWLRVARNQCACAFAQHEFVDVHNNGRIIAQVKGAYVAKLFKHADKSAAALVKTVRSRLQLFGKKPMISHKQLVWLEGAQYTNV